MILITLFSPSGAYRKHRSKGPEGPYDHICLCSTEPCTRQRLHRYGLTAVPRSHDCRRCVLPFHYFIVSYTSNVAGNGTEYEYLLRIELGADAEGPPFPTPRLGRLTLS